jgi:hypothetical protein
MAIGKKTGGGSRKGVPNKVNKELKEMILGALDDVGGQSYLARQADENPAAFMSLVAKVLPKDIKQEISGKDGAAIQVNHSIENTKGWLTDIISGMNGTAEE